MDTTRLGLLLVLSVGCDGMTAATVSDLCPTGSATINVCPSGAPLFSCTLPPGTPDGCHIPNAIPDPHGTGDAICVANCDAPPTTVPPGQYTVVYDYARGCYPDSGPAQLLPTVVTVAADGTFDSDPSITWTLVKSGDVWGGTATTDGCTWTTVWQAMICTLTPRPAACH